MKITKTLKALGLKDQEPEIFLTLCKLTGFHPASTIANKAGLNRSTVYKSLMRLSEINMVNKTVKNTVTYFCVDDLEKTLELKVQKKQQEAKEIQESVKEITPILQDFQKHEVFQPKIRYFEGFEGVKKAYEDTLKEGKPIYAFEDINDFTPEFLEWINSDYYTRRVKKKIFANVLTPRNEPNLQYRSVDKGGFKETRFITEGAFPFETEINIYGNKVAFFSYREKETFAAIIESKTIASSMKSIFQLCWDQAK